MKIHNVVLLNPPMRIEEVFGSFSDWGGACPPTGLCYVAAFMRRAGYVWKTARPNWVHAPDPRRCTPISSVKEALP